MTNRRLDNTHGPSPRPIDLDGILDADAEDSAERTMRFEAALAHDFAKSAAEALPARAQAARP